MGRITQTDPEAEICVLSKDSGFDLLVDHVGGQNMVENIVRVKELTGKSVKMLGGNSKVGAYQAESNLLPQTETNPVRSGFKKAIAHFSEAKPPLPANYEKLLKALRKLLKADLGEADKATRAATVEKVAAKLLQEGFIRTDGEQNLYYHFSREDFERRLVKRILTLKPRSRAALFNVMKSSALPEQEWSEQEGEKTLDKLVKLKVFALDKNKIRYPDEQGGDVVDAEIVEAAPVEAAAKKQPAPKQKQKQHAALSEAAAKTLEVLRKINRTKPVSAKSLQNSIASWLRVDAAAAVAVYDELLAGGFISLVDKRIQYSL